MASSALFSGYRTVGLVCGGSQSHTYNLGDATFFATPIGKAYQVYSCDHLNVVMVSRQIRHTISHVVCHRERTFAATAAGIVVFDRGRPLRTLTWPGCGAAGVDEGDIVQLLIIGDFLLSLHASGILRVWRVPDAVQDESVADVVEPVNSIALPSGAEPTTLLHPDTYVNKVVVGTADGKLFIVNIATGKLLYTSSLALDVRITALAQSDVLDVVGVGLADGRIIVHHLRADATVFSLRHAAADDRLAGGAVTALAFTRDSTLPHPTLLSTNEHGSVALWNLDEKALQIVLPAAHNGCITAAAWMPHQPCFLTASEDNSLRIWQVDKFDGQPRPLRSRSGHAAPPRVIRYYGGASVASLASGASATSCELASAGADRALRYFHTALDRQNCELSQGSLHARAKQLGVHPNALRLGPIVALAVSDRRHAQWSDVVTAHAGDHRAYMWSWENKRLDDSVLPLPNEHETVTAVAISACGNFAILGGSQGTLVQFNMQSGARRGFFPRDPTGDGPLRTRGKRRRAPHEIDIGSVDRDVGKGKSDGTALHKVDSIDTAFMKVMGIAPPRRAGASAAAVALPVRTAKEGATTAAPAGTPTNPHAGATICGIAVDALNNTMAVSDVSGLVSFWDFAGHALRSTVQLPSPASCTACHREANLFAVGCDDFSVRVLDMVTYRVVRTFTGHRNRITDMTFSTDARWLVSASLDRSVRVWDLPTARCVDWLSFQSAPTSVAFSPTSEYLVTSHVDQLGLSLWANKAHFGGAIMGALPEEPYRMDTPSATRTGDDEAEPADDGVLAASDAKANMAAASTGTKKARRAEGTNGVSAAAATSEVAPLAPECALEFSGLPSSTWMNLTRLDVIAARNKPMEPPKKPEAAPFFLPTTGGLNPTFVVSAVTDEDGAAAADGGSRVISSSLSARTAQSQLAVRLTAVAAEYEKHPDAETPALDAAVAEVVSFLRSLPASNVDAELRSLCLGPEDEPGIRSLQALHIYFEHALCRGMQVDLVQAQLQLAIQIYQDLFVDLAPLRSRLHTLSKAVDSQSNAINTSIDRCLCMLTTFLGQA